MAADQTAREAGTTARSATWADADALSRTMAAAFADDPLLSYIFKDPKIRQAKAPGLFKLMFKLGLPHGACQVTDGFEAAALWRPPNQWEIPLWQYIINGPEFLGLFGADCLRVMATMDRIEKAHPHEPNWYLQAIGTDPAKQGKGYGGVIIRHQLAKVDESGLPAYLESSKDSNIPIYASYGFEVTGEIKFPDGPTIYPMWRKARPAS